MTCDLMDVQAADIHPIGGLVNALRNLVNAPRPPIHDRPSLAGFNRGRVSSSLPHVQIGSKEVA
jgi:hypothetical protein